MSSHTLKATDVVPGDIVKFRAAIAGYDKYHIYLGRNEHDVLMFLYINSENGFAGDIVFSNADFPCIPGNATGESVVSFSMMPRVRGDKFAAMPTAICGRVSALVAKALADHCSTIRTLARSEKQFAIAAIAQM